jgi:transposase InsO family protein
MSKEDTISQVYYDLEHGFGNLVETLQQAKVLDKSITRADVQAFLAKQEGTQNKKAKQNNSFVPLAEARQQFQMDLADMGTAKGRAGWFRYALVANDIFTKKVAVVPMKDKTSETTAVALDKILKKLGQPVEIFTDEGGEFMGAFDKRAREYYEIAHRFSRTPPIFVERFIGTLKAGLRVRVAALEDDKWWKVLSVVVNKYNARKHTTTQMSPDDLAEENVPYEEREAKEDRAWNNIDRKAHRRRKYHGLQVGDSVKIIRKPGKYSEYKAGFISWHPEIRIVEEIYYDNGVKIYKVSGYKKHMMRHEMLKIQGVENAPRERLRAQQAELALDDITDNALRAMLARAIQA